MCRHRGNKLLWNDFPGEEVSGTCRQFTCKYHAWRYSLDGDLTFVQQEGEFFDLDKSQYGLVSVRPLGTTLCSSSGNWSLAQPEPALGNGLHTVRAKATDSIGHTGSEASISFTVNSTPPAPPNVDVPANGYVSPTALPSYSGTKVTGTTVTVFVDGVPVGSTPSADSASTSWSLVQPLPGLAEGSHSFWARATNSLGTPSSNSIPISFTVDTLPPDPPSFSAPAGGSTINLTRPIYSGTAEPGSTVSVFLDAATTALGTTLCSSSGNWSLAQPEPALGNGPHTVRAKATDSIGHTGAEASISFTVNSTPPAPPNVDVPANGYVSPTALPSYSGTKVTGTTVTVFVDGVPVGSTPSADSASTSWSLVQPLPALAEGSHSFWARATNSLGTPSSNSIPISFTVDTLPPDPPSFSAPAGGSTINLTRPIYSGTAEPGSTVSVFLDAATTAIGTTPCSSSGNWSLAQPEPALGNGPHTVRAKATDSIGHTGAEASISFTVNSTPPAPPNVDVPANGYVSPTALPSYSGTKVTGTTVTVFVDGVPVGSTPSADSASTSWSLVQPLPALAEGSHSFWARATNSLGTPSSNSIPISFTVDTLPPEQTTILAPANNSRTNVTRPIYSGTAEPGSTVSVFLDAATTAIGTTPCSSSGNWSLAQPEPALGNGPHTVRAKATDSIGHTGAEASISFTVDASPPTPPSVIAPANGYVSPTALPSYSGTKVAGTTVTVFVDGVPVGSTPSADSASTSWSLQQPLPALAEGSHSLWARATNSLGTPSVNSIPTAFTVDTLPPGLPSFSAPTNNSTINLNRPIYSGTAEPSSIVSVSLDGSSSPIGTTLCSSSGSWSLAHPLALTALIEGSHSLSAKATDAAGNTAGSTVSISFTVDTSPPASPNVDVPANGYVSSTALPSYSGTKVAGTTVTVFVDGVPVGSTPSADSASTSWSLQQPQPALAEGSHSLLARATDAASNLSPSSPLVTFTVDSKAPTAPIVTVPTNDSTTNNNKLTYMGTAEAGSKITVFEKLSTEQTGTEAGTTTANAAGEWSFLHETELADGLYTVTAKASDAAGHTSNSSNPRRFTVDTDPPDAPIFTGPVQMSRASPSYQGTSEEKVKITLRVDNDTVLSATQTRRGRWVCPQPTPLTNGTHHAVATATDAAGNTSQPSELFPFIVDTIPPEHP